MKHPFFNQYKFRYLEWNDAEVIHEVTVLWQSQLLFINDELEFLGALITRYTSQLISHSSFKSVQELASELDVLLKELPIIQERLKTHRNQLEVLLDGKDEFEKERGYQDAHLLLELKMEAYQEQHKTFKEKLYQKMIEVFGKEKKQLS